MNLAIRYILINVAIGAGGQMMLKKGMGEKGPLSLSLSGISWVAPFGALGQTPTCSLAWLFMQVPPLSGL
jgi:hypothetical protein